MQDISTIDWNQVWKEQMQERNSLTNGRAREDKWKDPEECRKFDRRVKEDNWKRSREMISRMDLSKKSRILDIGAGPGTLAIPLAQSIEHVTALEPSDAMLSCLKENIRAYGLDNIKIVRKTWEEADITKDLSPPYDLVIASYAVGFEDLREALQKMNDASSKYVYIYWFADSSPWEKNYAELWEKLHGVPYRRMGKYNVIYNLLYQMGIMANVDIYAEESTDRFASLDDAVADQRAGFNITDERQEAILREFLQGRMLFENGKYVLRGMSHRARIWWKKES
jgi:SAM-dependent methyltransferase